MCAAKQLLESTLLYKYILYSYFPCSFLLLWNKLFYYCTPEQWRAHNFQRLHIIHEKWIFMLIIQRIKNKFVFNGTKRKIFLKVVCCCRWWLYPTFELGNLATATQTFSIAFRRKSLCQSLFHVCWFCKRYALHFAYLKAFKLYLNRLSLFKHQNSCM